MSDVSPQDKLFAAAVRRLEQFEKTDSFDPARPNSKPTPKQEEVFRDFSIIKQQWIRAGNQSGKSATCARIVSWVITDTHPTWKRPEEWGSEPLLVIVSGRTGKQIEDSLLPKIRGYLEVGSYKEVRIGNIIQRLELTNGNRVIFQSLENPNVARERLQSYVAHLVWTDELPPTMDIVRELLIRVQARNGYFLASFTPTVVSTDIQKYVDALSEPEGKVYRFHMLDNPLYSDPVRRQELLDRYKHLPEHVRNSIFEGEWLSADDQVYYFDYRTMVQMPIGYTPMWRHSVSIDPGARTSGLTVWAENPVTSVWYCILAEYLHIPVPTDLVNEVNKITAHLNVCRRISDPHEVWFMSMASSMGTNYMGVYKKNDRKQELIKNFQESLGKQVRLSPSCPDIISEVQECRWSSRTEGKIINASRFHLLDSSQYFVDNIPKPEIVIQTGSWENWLYQQNHKLQVAEDKQRHRLTKKNESRMRVKSVSRSRWSR